jgi:hypothetical protein
MRTWIRCLPFALVVVTACARQHITPTFGRANHEVFSAQVARPENRRAPPPSMALDAQEAEVIGEAYLRGLAGKQGKAEPQPVLVVDPQGQVQAGAAQRLAPSVPKE